MKKICKKILLVFALFLAIVLVGCNANKEYIVIFEYNTGEDVTSVMVKNGSILETDDDIENEGYEFKGWYLDEELTIPVDSGYVVKSDITIYAKWEIKTLSVKFYVDEELYDIQNVEYGGYLDEVSTPEKQGYTFLYWGTSKDGLGKFDLNRKVKKDVDVFAKFEPIPYLVTYDLGYKVSYTKEELYVNYFTDFYNFMVEKTDVDFSKYKIENLEQFLEFCKNWDANGKDSFYGVGDAFDKYYVTKMIGGTLEEQPDTTFVGYCYKNNMYVEFIPFLMTFFEYWRTDEGYTGSSSDPDNTGNDFFASPWASLVDTCKFFYFTSENLNDTYPWFTSARVKDALDNVAGLEEEFKPVYGDIENPIILKTPERAGYTFVGWYDENNNKVFVAAKEMTVYAKWEKQ